MAGAGDGGEPLQMMPLPLPVWCAGMYPGPGMFGGPQGMYGAPGMGGMDGSQMMGMPHLQGMPYMGGMPGERDSRACTGAM